MKNTRSVPYQREGMLHLAFGERALLADEMGLGKTIQAVAACALLHHLGKAKRVLVVTPASLKAEWEDQIRRFTTLSQQIVFGPRSARIKHYTAKSPPFFTLVNYEQVVTDTIEHAMLETLALKSNLAHGVLDGSDESLANTKLKRGADANLARLKQFLSIAPSSKPAGTKPQPADPTLHFAERAAATLGQSLVHCQEAMLPGDTTTPVLLTVLRDPTRAAAVSALYQEIRWGDSPPKLHVLDEPTWASLQQLAETGLITFNTRATRHLAGEAPPTPPKPALPPEQLQRIADLRAFAAKKQKVARLLIESDLPEEAEPHQKAADEALAEAEEIENGRIHP
jgi:hypothetical protein